MEDAGDGLVQIRGRGAAHNPPNRFERLSVVPDDEPPDEDDPGPRTVFLRDASRTVLSHNDSPDVGFGHSVNPYRGCEHGCVYCVDGETSVLMADGSTRPIAELRVGDRIYGTVRQGWYRRYVETLVLAHWQTDKPSYRVTLEDGTELIASGDHRFLTDRGWKYVIGAEQGRNRRPHLRVGDKLMGVGAFAPPQPDGPEYRRGYLCGVIRGDGLLASYHYGRIGRHRGDQHQFRLVMADADALDRAADYLREFSIPTWRCAFADRSGARPMEMIRNHARASVERVRELVEWPDQPCRQWRAGFLAGVFDAEGSYSDGILRMVSTDPAMIEQTVLSLRALSLDCVVEHRPREGSRPMHCVRVTGGLRAHLRFLQMVRPAISRKRSIQGQALESEARLGVVSVDPLPGKRELFDITTGTGDFIANGVVSHNCYARPTHEYLGFSAGLDFESRILVKTEAPALLRRELQSRRWKPAPIAMSGVTDPYQPVERRLRLTRGCLEVLADFRNPVGIVTKNHLVTRDADLLGELAAHRAAVVYLSVTTLDPRLQRLMEPRASTPARRLEAVRELAAAGVPVGVMVAPVIPGLTDHEMPAILKAAAEAGATVAGFVPLRLPLGVAELFTRWLETHLPERKDKVLGRVREIRGGRLNDSRWGSRMRGEGEYAEQLRALFRVSCRRLGLNLERVQLSAAAFRRPDPTGQLGLFG